MRLLLISGHGAGDPGAVGEYRGRTWREADETRRVTAAVAEALKGDWDVTIYPTDRNAFDDHQKGTLAAVAQFRRYDYVLEIHFNAYRQTAADGAVKGVECYVPTDAPGDDVERAIVRRVAACGLTSRGVKRRNWSVIRAARRAGVPAALLEVCFLDDPDDMAVYTAKVSQIAAAIADGIREGFDLEEDETMTYETFCGYLDRYLSERAREAPSDWSAEARAWAEEAGVLRGDDQGRMKYRSFVTREELAQTLYRAENR